MLCLSENTHRIKEWEKYLERRREDIRKVDGYEY